MIVLLHALLLAVLLGALHVALSWSGPLPPVRFVALASIGHVAIGLLLWLPLLVRQGLRAWTTAWWIPVLAIGLFATGLVAGAAWVGAVKGLERLLRRS